MNNLFEKFEGRRLFAGYGTNGVASLRFRVADSSETVQVKQLVTDSTGRAYVMATTKTTLQVQRLTAAGELDTTFAKHGSLLFVRTANTGGAAEVHVDAADRLVVLQDDTIVRVNDKGTGDVNFARGGVLKLTGFKTVNDFTVDANNKVYVTGATKVGSTNVDGQMRVERFISRGKLDSTFDGDGVYDLPFFKAATGTRTGNSAGVFIRALSDGSVVAAGNEYQGTTAKPGKYSTKGIRAVKFSGNGVDTTYGTSGVATVYPPANNDLTGYDVRLQGIRATGQTVWWYTSDDGGLDPTPDYNENRQFTLAGGVTDTALAGASETSYYFNLDTAYGTGNSRTDLAVLDNRRIAGLNADGSVKSTFNSGQTLQVTYATGSSEIGAAADDARDGDDNLLVAGKSRAGVRVTVAKVTTGGAIVTA